MKNPNGPYPGRQLFLGMTADGKPAFAYLVTGRSPASRERLATPRDNGIIMGPIGNAPYDPLRHYTAVKYDNGIGMAAVSNGIQTEAVFETYRLIYNVKSAPSTVYIKKIMDGANFEPDSLNTPRIGAVICNDTNDMPVFIISIKAFGRPAAWRVRPTAGTLYGVSTYRGRMDKPMAFNIADGPAELKFTAKTPREIADFIYEISAATYQGEDIRVCSIGGIRTGTVWETALVNRHRE